MSLSRVSPPIPRTSAVEPRDGVDAPAVSETLEAPPPERTAVAVKLFREFVISPPDTFPYRAENAAPFWRSPRIVLVAIGGSPATAVRISATYADASPNV